MVLAEPVDSSLGNINARCMGKKIPPFSAISCGNLFSNCLTDSNGNAPKSGGRSDSVVLPSGTLIVRRKEMCRDSPCRATVSGPLSLALSISRQVMGAITNSCDDGTTKLEEVGQDPFAKCMLNSVYLIHGLGFLAKPLLIFGLP